MYNFTSTFLSIGLAEKLSFVKILIGEISLFSIVLFAFTSIITGLLFTSIFNSSSWLSPVASIASACMVKLALCFLSFFNCSSLKTSLTIFMSKVPISFVKPVVSIIVVSILIYFISFVIESYVSAEIYAVTVYSILVLLNNAPARDFTFAFAIKSSPTCTFTVGFSKLSSNVGRLYSSTLKLLLFFISSISSVSNSHSPVAASVGILNEPVKEP